MHLLINMHNITVWKSNQLYVFDPCLIVTWRELSWLVFRPRTPHGDASPDCFVKSVIRLSDTRVTMTQEWLGPGVITYHRKYDCGVESSAHPLSGLLNTLDRGNLRQLETKNIWPTEPQKSITDWNVKSQGAKYIEDSLNHFKMSIMS